MQKKLIMIVAAVAIVGTTLLSARDAFAQTSDTTTAPMHSLVEKISTKFGLNKDAVEAVFVEEGLARQAARREHEDQRLSQLVAEGKLTQAHKQLLIAKRDELRTQRQKERDTFRNMTLKERRAIMEKRHQALETWAKANGIDPQYLLEARHGEKGMSMKGKMPSYAQPY